MKNNILLISLTITLLALPNMSKAQNDKIDRARQLQMHNEIPGDVYLPADPQRQLTSPAYRFESSLFYTTQVNINSNGENILNDAANEPSMAIDPLNTGRIAIGWRQFDNVGNNFRQAGYSYTNDGGESWTFPGVINPGVFRSDPVLEADNQGVFYYNSLTSSGGNYFCRVYKSDDGGASWDLGTSAQGGDKQWMEIDKTGGLGEGHIYSFWTSYYSICYPGHFTRSTDGGDYYEECISVDGNPYWGTMAVGPDGELYIAGAGFDDGIVVVRSDNANDPDAFVAWEYYTQVDMDGAMMAGPDVNPGGLLGQASIAVNHAPGSGLGDVYVLASVARLTNGDPGDVMFAKSTDGGLSFGAPIRINDDFSNSNTQWFGTMSVAPNGRIDVVWLDTRDAPTFSPLYSALYYSYSLDQGETWSDNELLSESFDPHLGWPNQEKMGDYFDLISDNDNAHLAWSNTLNGEQDVYYGRINPVITGNSSIEAENPIIALQASPNPCRGNARLTYRLAKSAHVSIIISDILGREIANLVNETQTAGTHSIQLTDNLIGNGIFFCRLTSGKYSKTIKLVGLE
ncbi:MAG: hypothetical protein CVU14_00960 [Bacteroidetes bacterium HGW-Bacteroidetes-9]|jgi:Neuraminidase (sialidase)|nr:MAG: hypothetical protein CVU14_00960 [Bacteroidetes bacterium HGW-Bacteroidetes-9]